MSNANTLDSLRISYGGKEVTGKRKIERPFLPGSILAMEFVARPASGTYSLLHRKNRARVQHRVYSLARRYGIRIRHFNNLGSRLKLVFVANDRYALTCFLRVMAGQIAQMITGARKGVKSGKYWARLCWSKLVKVGENIQAAKKWIENFLTIQNDPSTLSESINAYHPHRYTLAQHLKSHRRK